MRTMKDVSRVHLTRRQFVKKASFGAGAAVFAGSLPVQLSAYAGGSETLKLALIGCGGRGSGAASQALQADKGVKLVAMADVFRDKLDSSYQNLLQRHANEPEKIDVPEEHKFIGFDAYKKAIELADVVVLATPQGFRPIHFEAAIDAGKHVFMEKPLASDVPGVHKVLEAGRKAKEKNLSVVVGLQRRYEGQYRTIMQKIHDGEIGKIMCGQIYWNEEGAWMHPRRPEYSELEYQLRNWFYFNWLSGDLPIEQHIHNIDVANWIIGEYPVKAQGMGGREVRIGKEYGDIYDHNFVALTYPGGAVINSQCRHQPGTYSIVGEEFQGCNGSVSFTWRAGAAIRNSSGIVTYEHDSSNDLSPYQVEHNELFESIRNGKPINNAEYGAKSTLSGIMVRMASYSGKVITWDDAFNSTQQLMPEKLDWSDNPPTLPDADGYYPIPVPGVTDVLA